MNLAYFISKRLTTAIDRKSSISAPIIKIAIAAIAIGIIMMMIAISTGLGLQQKIREKVVAFNGHISVSNFDNNQSEVNVNPINVNQDFYKRLNNVEGINYVQKVATKAAIIRTSKDFEGILFKGVGKEYNWNFIKDYIVQGKIPNLKNEINSEVIISEYLANRLNLKLGAYFNAFFMKDGNSQLPNLRIFKIVGVFNSGFPEFDSKFILGDIRHLQRINKWLPNQVGSFEIFVNDFSKIQAIGDQVYAQTSSELKSETVIEKFGFIFQWLQLFDFNIIVIVAVMIAVASINMVVALLVLILERTKMIGILKAMGANNWLIRKVFLYNAVFIIFKGLLWGNVIGIGLLFIQKTFNIIKLNPENYYVSSAPVVFDFTLIALLNLGTILIVLLVLLIPSYIITKITPIKAIRYD